jgi:beta-barrel assembly-enhancing protease
MLKIKSILLFVSILVATLIIAQQDLDYLPLRAKGEIPQEFVLPSYRKVDVKIEENKKRADELKLKYKADMRKATTGAEQSEIKRIYENDFSRLNDQQQQIFSENTVYGIDEILHSGLVLYGDSLSNYTREVAAKLLGNQPDLFAKLQFYTLKVNESNAFSTDQGIVFCTVGLLAQIENEAQLAYILAHEISHYTKKHVLESYVFSSSGQTNRTDYAGQINDMGKFSKSAEFEADTLAIEMFNGAGYDKNEIANTFNVLLYAYLPFEELKLEQTYYNKGFCYIPPSQFPNEYRPITAAEDKSDLNSTHPNMKSRKQLAASQLSDYTDWGSELNSLGDDYFYKIQRIARFESVRNNLFESEFGKALYSLYTLEKSYPTSHYLARCKAQAWLGLAQFKTGAKFSKTVDRKKSLEGESANMHLLLYEMDNKTIVTMALRQIKDVMDMFPEDQMVLLIWDRIVKVAAENKSFDLQDYKKTTFTKAADDFYAALKLQDSLKNFKASVPVEEPKISKYDRIKNSKKKTVNDRVFDSTSYYQYIIPDLIEDQSFLNVFNSHKEEKIAQDRKIETIEGLSGRKRHEYLVKLENENLALGVNDIVVVEPVVSKYRDGVIDRVQSEKLAAQFSQATAEASKSLYMTVFRVDKSTLDRTTTPGFNERSCLMQLMNQLQNADDLNLFPVDFELLEEVKQNYGTSTVVFTFVSSAYDLDMDYNAIYAAILFPVGMVYFPTKIISGNTTSINLFVLDLDKGKVIISQNSTFQQPLSKGMLKGRIYDILYQMKQKPSIR